MTYDNIFFSEKNTLLKILFRIIKFFFYKEQMAYKTQILKMWEKTPWRFESYQLIVLNLFPKVPIHFSKIYGFLYSIIKKELNKEITDDIKYQIIKEFINENHLNDFNLQINLEKVKNKSLFRLIILDEDDDFLFIPCNKIISKDLTCKWFQKILVYFYCQ